jgi:hypothetical protein
MTSAEKTITFAAGQAADTVTINGLVFTAHANTTTVATRTFSVGADEDAAAVQLALCINDATYGVPGVTATAALHVVTLTATTATTTQCVTGTGGARVVCAQVIPTLLNLTPYYTGNAANSTVSDGIPVEVYVDGYPQLYIGIRNDDAVNAATFVVGATLLAA